MSDDQGTGFEWRRKRGWLNRTVEKVEDLPVDDGHSAAVDWPATSGGRFS